MVHFLIALAYSYFSYSQYLSDNSSGSLGTGIQLWFFALTHLVLTILFCAIPLINTKPRKPVIIKLLLNVGAVVFWTVLHWILSEPITDYLEWLSN